MTCEVCQKPIRYGARRRAAKVRALLPLLPFGPAPPAHKVGQHSPAG